MKKDLNYLQEELQKTIKKLESKKIILQEKLVERDFYLKQLKDDFECSSPEEAEELIESYENEIEKTEIEIEEEYTNLMEEIEELELL